MSQYALNAYRSTSVRSAVDGATPHALILMLYDGALTQLRNAKAQMKSGDIAGKARSASRAIEIIDQGLRGNLNLEAGGEVAANLRALYDYCEHRILLANARNEAALLDEVVAILERLRGAWHGIGASAAAR